MINLVLPTWQVLQGDALSRLREMPSESVHCVVTSPPYFGLRDYGTGQWEGGDAGCDHKKVPDPMFAVATSTLDGGKKTTGHLQEGFGPECGKCGAKRIDTQIGLEATPAEFIAALVGVFREVRRVLRKDGTCWVNLGDSYAANRGNGASGCGPKQLTNSGSLLGKLVVPDGLKPKDLMMMPARVALALQDDGWYLRSEITWCKRAPMPESVTDRPTSATEKIFLLAREARYFYDQEAVREPSADPTRTNYKPGKEAYTEGNVHGPGDGRTKRNDGFQKYAEGAMCNGHNLRNFWLLSPEAYPEAHFATFPTEIPRSAIKAGTSEHGCCPECGAQWRRVVNARGWHKSDYVGPKMQGYQEQGLVSNKTGLAQAGWQPTCAHKDLAPVPCTVLDPFSGAGTTGMVALELGRNYIGIELNEEYVELSRRRIQKEMPLIAWGAGV